MIRTQCNPNFRALHPVVCVNWCMRVSTTTVLLVFIITITTCFGLRPSSSETNIEYANGNFAKLTTDLFLEHCFFLLIRHEYYSSTTPTWPRKVPSAPLTLRLYGSQSRSGRFGVENNFLPLLGIESQPSNPYSSTTPPELSRFLFCKCIHKIP
jgi:hypothetical protein